MGAEGRERQAWETIAGVDRDATPHARETERCGPPSEVGANVWAGAVPLAK